LTGVCPLIAWRKASLKNFRRNFLTPLAGGFVVGALTFLAGVRGLIPLAFFSASGFVAMTVFYEFYKGARARQTIRPTRFAIALLDLFLMNKRRYGGFVIHMGVVLVFTGIIASSFFSSEEFFTVKSGEEFSLAGYTLRFQGLSEQRDPEKDVVRASEDVIRDGRQVDTLYPEKHFHHKSEQPMTEVRIRSTLREDLYLVLSGWDENQAATFHVFINPMVQFIWIGIGIMVLGGVFVLLPNQKPGPAVALRRPVEDVRDEAA
jgi:cytochrome c-type biogenesis protein CcmF